MEVKLQQEISKVATKITKKKAESILATGNELRCTTGQGTLQLDQSVVQAAGCFKQEEYSIVGSTRALWGVAQAFVWEFLRGAKTFNMKGMKN